MEKRVKRIYIEKKPQLNVEAQVMLQDLQENLGIEGLKNLRVINYFDISGLSEEEFQEAREGVFGDPLVDLVYDEDLTFSPDDYLLAMEYLPGQYDQHADSLAHSIQFFTLKERPEVRRVKVLVFQGHISEEDFQKIKDYLINPVESRETTLDKPESITLGNVAPDKVENIAGFIQMTPKELEEYHGNAGLAMSEADLAFCQEYFRDEEKRDPTITELRFIDTYWSDHCRHTTFHTSLEKIRIEEGPFASPIKKAFEGYKEARNFVYGDKVEERDLNLMDIAVIGMKELRKKGLLEDLDESEEINACSIVVPVDVNGEEQEWLVMFKNETHNHPTEIEPFGGANTCLGGAIRDPLSGRTYVYQAMRITGSADPQTKIEDTLPGKLPQRKITREAAAGYSSYGNQIGVSAGQVVEFYDEDFVAKRMELGAVVAAAPRKNVVRHTPQPGDVVVLVGGRTGRDGCGGATGSSKEHTTESLITCGSDVQKGNPPIERNIQRLFRNPQVSTMIKKCNDFGAGGVSVAIGELTDGLEINLDAVPTKYEGLDGTELAISESQERMAVVISSEDLQDFIAYADGENLEATKVADVTSDPRLKIFWRGEAIVDISREFLDTNGVKQKTQVEVKLPDPQSNYFKSQEKALLEGKNLREAWLNNLQDLNVSSQKGLVEQFDSSIGGNAVLMPLGGKNQVTPALGMVSKIPLLEGETTTATAMTFGYNPQLAKWSPFHGGLYAVVDSVTKMVALGGDYSKIRLTFQEYFERLGEEPQRWGKPFSALLGALTVQRELGIAAIGGKDSMSGTFNDLHVPPTLVSFAVGILNTKNVVSQEFKKADSQILLVPARRDEEEVIDFEHLTKNFRKVHELIKKGKVLASHNVGMGGIAAALSKMAFGNNLGINLTGTLKPEDYFRPDYGSIILEIPNSVDLEEVFGEVEYLVLGNTQEEAVIRGENLEITLEEAITTWEKPLASVFPIEGEGIPQPQEISYKERNEYRPTVKFAKPLVFIPIFPGTNGEYDAELAFSKAGAAVETMVVRNLTPVHLEESIEALAKKIQKANIIMLPGGSGEPVDTGKHISTLFRHPRLKEAIMELLSERDGLILGIGSGFQALVRLGLLPYGEIRDFVDDSIALTTNKIGRHVSTMVNTKVVSTLSPWFRGMEVGDIHTIPVSSGEGRFVAKPEVLQGLIQKGQIPTQYVDSQGKASGESKYNPFGSMEAIEGITSPDGRVFGKMGHSERTGVQVAINISGKKVQNIFGNGVNYFRS
ncbi:MAG: phosphoribosylformylglycinamidine synthase [Desulfitobacterium sp.]|nr:phosphoribosylformylglycinamidine synthase [Desulfitobacterium sp.]